MRKTSAQACSSQPLGRVLPSFLCSTHAPLDAPLTDLPGSCSQSVLRAMFIRSGPQPFGCGLLGTQTLRRPPVLTNCPIKPGAQISLNPASANLPPHRFSQQYVYKIFSMRKYHFHLKINNNNLLNTIQSRFIFTKLPDTFFQFV